MRNRLRRSAREAVRNEYGENVIFLAMKNPCEHFSTKMPKFRLSAEECFLEFLAVLDDIKEDERKATFNLEHRWNKIYNDFRDLAGEETELKELELATSVVLYCVVLLLTFTGKPSYNTLVLRLMEQLDEHGACIVELKDTFMPNIYRMDFEKLKAAIGDYMECDVFLSDDIEEMVANVEDISQATSTSGNRAGVSDTSNLRIAPGKETSMLVVLDTMYKAGWFVDTKNKPVKNKKKTIDQILQYAFNKTNANVDQLLNAAYKRNYDVTSYFDELMEKLPEKD